MMIDSIDHRAAALVVILCNKAGKRLMKGDKVMTNAEIQKQGFSKANVAELKRLADSNAEFRKLYSDCVRNGGNAGQLTLISLLCYRMGITAAVNDMLLDSVNA